MESSELGPETSDAPDSGSDADSSTESSASASRRRFVLSGLIGVPIVLTLTSRSAWTAEQSGGASAGYGGGGGEGGGETSEEMPDQDPFSDEGREPRYPDFGR